MTDRDAQPDPDGSTDEARQPEEELKPAFDIDMDPDEQGTAEAAAESSG